MKAEPRKPTPKRKSVAARAPAPPARTSGLKAPAAARPAGLSAREIERRLAVIEPKWTQAEARERVAGSIAAQLKALEGSSETARTQAAQSLGASGALEAIPALRGRLGDDSKEVRSAAAIALVRLGDKAVFKEMLKGLGESSSRAVVGAAMALGLSGKPEAVEPLLAAFKTHDAAVGGAVACALGMLGDARAVPALITALKAGFASAEVCRALGRLGDAAALPALAKALKHHDPTTRAEAARALGRLRAALEAAPAKEKILAALRKLLDDANQRVRLSAALALYELGDRGASARLVEVLQEA